ncbi:hypothetical protein WJX84_005860 [Apatococcus fuscideae]|uniref:Protein kinase domain-containing protein n=1 Tax=Apatococcus fuscideae TaxID=2026836 RepID=A0AAW1T1P8_9CHLO
MREERPYSDRDLEACILGDPISYNGLNACLVLNDVLSKDTFDNADDLESGLYDLFGYQSGSSSLCYTALGAVSEDYACLCATIGQGHDYDFWPETSTGCDDACAPNGDYWSYTSSAFIYPDDPIILSLPISSDVPQLSSPALKEATLDYSWSQPFTLCASAEAAFIGTSFQPLQASFNGVTLAATDQQHQPLCNGYNDAVSKSLCLCLDWDINQVPDHMYTPGTLPPVLPKSRAGQIAGLVIGCVIGGGIVLAYLASGIWFQMTYNFRANNALIQDTIYNLLVSPGPLHGEDHPHPTSKGSWIEGQRFMDILPFVSRLPRNDVYASCVSTTAGDCLRMWGGMMGTHPSVGRGVFRDNFAGMEAEALAFCCLKYESMWAASDKAILQMCARGRHSRGQLCRTLETMLFSDEASKFLEALDQRHVYRTRLRPTLKQSLLLRLPNHRMRPPTDLTHRRPARAWRPWKPLASGSAVFSTELTAWKGSLSASSPKASGAQWEGLQTPARMSELQQQLNHAAHGQADKPVTPSSPWDTPPSIDDAALQPFSQVLRAALSRLGMQDWELKQGEIKIDSRPNGTLWSLGQGGFGQVYRATWNGTQTVAVKTLKPNSTTQAGLDFLQEVAILRQAHAENVVRFLGVCIQNDSILLVTEYMAGGDLFHALADPRSRAALLWHRMFWTAGLPSVGQRVALDICRGVAFLHSRNIVHFDIKSPNILLTGRSSPGTGNSVGTAKVGDVGLARLLRQEAFSHVTCLGTLQWAAPELVGSQATAISAKVDVYSLGIVLWELVTGASPVFGKAWYREVRVPEECPGHVANIIAACLRQDPAARPSSQEVYQQLKAGMTVSDIKLDIN